MKRCLALLFITGIILSATIPETEWNGDPNFPVIVYQSKNAKGDMQRLTVGMYPEVDYFLGWKNGFESIHLKEGYEIMFYSFLSFQGEKFHLATSSMDVAQEAGFRPLSMKVIKTKEPEACMNYINFEIPKVKRITDNVRLKAEEKFWDEASSFCASCGEKIGVNFERSGFVLKKNDDGKLRVMGSVNCLALPSDSFFKIDLNHAEEK